MNCIFLRRGYGEIKTTPPAPEILSNFSANEWSTIIYACQNNLVPSSWAVGNNKTMNIGGTNYQIDIIGKGHDTYSSGGTAPLTFQLHDCYGTEYAMGSGYNNTGGWTDSIMRKTHLPSILTKMPSEVQEGIKEVNKKTSAGNASSTINTTADKLFLLSERELANSNSQSKSGEGNQYAYYSSGNGKVKTLNGTATNWWLRSPTPTRDGFAMYQSNDQMGWDSPYRTRGVSFAFCF